jgi:S1-C subfamily serine protease
VAAAHDAAVRQWPGPGTPQYIKEPLSSQPVPTAQAGEGAVTQHCLRARALRWFIAIVTAVMAVISAVAADEPRRQSTADLIAARQPSVVNIFIVRHTKTSAPAGNIATQNTTVETTVQSSGFFVDPTGLILTNRHVIVDASEIIVTLHDSSRLRASILTADTTNDLALLKVNTGNTRSSPQVWK